MRINLGGRKRSVSHQRLGDNLAICIRGMGGKGVTQPIAGEGDRKTGSFARLLNFSLQEVRTDRTTAAGHKKGFRTVGSC